MADPGDTTLTLYGLPRDTKPLIRAFTGVDASSTGGQSSTNGVQANGTPAPTPTSAPTDNIQAAQYSVPVLMGDSTMIYSFYEGYAGFQGQNLYQTYQKVVTNQNGDGGGTTSTTTCTVGPLTAGGPVVTAKTQGSATDYGTTWQIDSDA